MRESLLGQINSNIKKFFAYDIIGIYLGNAEFGEEEVRKFIEFALTKLEINNIINLLLKEGQIYENVWQIIC